MEPAVSTHRFKMPEPGAPMTTHYLQGGPPCRETAFMPSVRLQLEFGFVHLRVNRPPAVSGPEEVAHGVTMTINGRPVDLAQSSVGSRSQHGTKTTITHHAWDAREVVAPGAHVQISSDTWDFRPFSFVVSS